MNPPESIFDIENSHPDLARIARSLAIHATEYMNSRNDDMTFDVEDVYEMELWALYKDEVKDEQAVSP